MKIIASVPVPPNVDGLTAAELFAAAGVAPEDIEKGAHIYISKSEQLVVCVGLMRGNYPSDEYRPLYRSDFPGYDRDELRRLHGGAREGAGRPAGPPQLNIRIAATSKEKETILANTTPRQRAEILLEAARKDALS